MILLMILVFLAGYLMIALEHPLRVNKAAPALIICVVLWMMYMFSAAELIPTVSPDDFAHFLESHPSVGSLPYADQVRSFVVDHKILDAIGEAAEILLFLMGAMTIVELIDTHGGFHFITNRITTTDKSRLLWTISGITFFMSAALDNLTTTIVMVMLLRKLIDNQRERWVYASMIVISANAGGAWSPVGDVTTIMLWVKGNITSMATITKLILPCIIAVVIPTAIAARILQGIIKQPDHDTYKDPALATVTRNEKLSILIIGVLCLVCIPIFKSVTHLPPFMGVLLGLGIMWIYTELMYKNKLGIEESIKHRVSNVIRNIDMPTILFFLGILMAVSALAAAGVLDSMALYLDEKVHNVYVVNLLIGLLSSIVDNVPLVAGALGMYSVTDATSIAAAADPAYAAFFVQDGIFWQFLAYCAGVGGSVLIIGSAAGVVAMGLEKINFIWYLKNISWIALIGYFAGAAAYILQNMII